MAAEACGPQDAHLQWGLSWCLLSPTARRWLTADGLQSLPQAP